MTLEQALTPKAQSEAPESGADFGDDRVQCGDDDFNFGLNITNTIHSHEYGGNGEATCGLSTTPKFEIARKYALGSNGNLAGRVIKMSVDRLKDAGVKIHSVNISLNSPSTPEDDEYWIYFHGYFPNKAIVSEIEVFPD